MTTISVEERLTALEKELAELKQQLATDKSKPTLPWWEQRFGAFANSPEYEQAMQAGRKYRESLRPNKDENADCSKIPALKAEDWSV